MPLTLNPPPPTPVEPVTETLHGVPITDPYRWLEDQNSPRTREWLEDQTAYTQTYMDGIPCRERIRKRITELLKVDTISGPRKAGNRYFFLKRSSTQEQPSIIACDGRLGKETVLVDPAQRPESSVLSLEIV